MLINLLPDFFAVLDSTDRLAAYQRYFDSHRNILEPYWHNYVIDPDSPHFLDMKADVYVHPATHAGSPSSNAAKCLPWTATSTSFSWSA